jgi:hypothetical protein
MIKRLIPMLLAGLAVWQWQSLRRYRQEAERMRLKAKPHEVTTWEGEGGALHGTGSHTGPDPVLP